MGLASPHATLSRRSLLDDYRTSNSVAVVINEQDQVVYQKRLPNDLSQIAQQLSSYRRSLQGIVVESTYNWYWLVDGLMEKGYRVHLANTAAIQQYNGLKYTDDDSDARWLAHLLRLGILPEGDRRRANPYLTYSIATNLGHARNVLIGHSADALIAVDGSYGTVSEAAIALKLGKPVIALTVTWDLAGVKRAGSPRESVDLAWVAVKE